MTQLRIRYYDRPKQAKQSWMVVGIRGGYINLDNLENVEYNPAAIFVYCSYIKDYLKQREIDADVDIDADLVSVSAVSEEKNFKFVVEKLVESILLTCPGKADFEKAKKMALENMEAHFQNVVYRGWMHIQEYVHQKSDFDVHRLMKNLYEITYEQFGKSMSYMLQPENLIIYLCSSNNILFGEIIAAAAEKFLEKVPEVIKNAGEASKEEQRQKNLMKYTGHWTKRIESSESYSISAIYFDFEDKKCTLTQAYCFISFIAAALFKDKAMAYVSEEKAAIIFENKKQTDYREQIPGLFVSEVLKNIGQYLLYRMAYYWENDTVFMLKTFLTMECRGIDAAAYIRYLKENFEENMSVAVEKCVVNISIGTVIFGNGGKEYV